MNTTFTHAALPPRGFTLVEALVAISILLVAVVFPLALVSDSLQNADAARDRVVATYLAQESLEQMVRLRDLNALRENGGVISPASALWEWYNNDLPSACTNSAGCDFDTRTSAFRPCGALGGCRLYQDETPTDGYYSYDPSGTLSPFTRTVSVASVSDDREVEITVTVSWQSLALDGTDQVVVRGAILNQYDGI